MENNKKRCFYLIKLYIFNSKNKNYNLGENLEILEFLDKIKCFNYIMK